MCNFFSAIVMPNGDLFWNPYTDAHEDLIALNNLRDTKAGNFARVEFSPEQSSDLDKPDKYKLRIDEERTPDWLDEDRKEKVSEQLRSIIKRMIVSGPATCLIGGSYILAKGASVEFTKSCRIIAMLGSSKVGEMWESSKVGEMRESSQVGEMRESSQVGMMWGSSKVGEMRGSSQVGMMWESSQVGEMRESSKVGEMRESSQVGMMWGSSQVGMMWESSKVGEMRGSSKAPKKPMTDRR